MKKMILPMLLAVALVASAKPVDPMVLSRMAASLFPGHTVTCASAYDGMLLFVPDGGEGFVLLASDDCVRPVLAFSHTGVFPADGMPAHVAQWLDGYLREIASVRASGIGQTPQVAAEWHSWLDAPGTKNEGDSIGPLLTTAWNQGRYFNTFCPYDQNDSMRCYTGCTATATAQIMKYWNHPTVGWGNHSYHHSLYGTLSAQFDTTYYRWSMMPDTLNYLTDPDSAAAVAELMYHVGVAVEMNYGTSGSGAAVNSYGSSSRASSENALKTYFKYNPMLYGVFKSSYTDSEWDSLMYNELLAGRPILYAGYDNSAGHAFVLDGVREMDDSLTVHRYYHVNWGWGGAYDGFYTIDSLSPGAGGIGGNATYTFNLNNSAVIGIMPVTAASDSVVTVSVVPDNYQHGEVTGSGEYVSLHDVVSIWAHAAEGYRFVRWKSGSMQNPLQFLACGDLTDTAIFEPLRGDTLGYCFDGIVTAWADDYGSTTQWAIRIPASMRGAGRNMSAVQLCPYEAGSYTLGVYIGATMSTASLVHTQVVEVAYGDNRSWHHYPLSQQVYVASGEVVWVTMTYQGGGYPASSSRYSGNSDGSWYHQPEGWVCFDEQDVFYGTWMLRAVFEPREVVVTVEPADIEVCSTYGEGTYMGGDQVTVGAVLLNMQCTFSHWNNGSVDNPYTFVADEDIMLVAHCNCPGLGIDDVEADGPTVDIEGRTVTVDDEASFYDMLGRCVAQGRVATLPAAGVYIVKTATGIKKVPIR